MTNTPAPAPVVPRFAFGVPRVVIPLALALFTLSSQAAEWIRAGLNTNQPIWGPRDGLQFAIHPGGFTRGQGGPRGLLRIGYPTLTNRQYDLINFIAVEPIVGDARGFSELEKSSIDGRHGKLFWTGRNPPGTNEPLNWSSGELITVRPGITQLTVPIRVEKFDNGAHVRLEVIQRSDMAGELRIKVHLEPDSAPIKTCNFTATMGNRARTRLLWLKDEPILSLKLFDAYTGTGFTPHRFYPLAQLPRTSSGDVLVAITSDEPNPAGTPGVPRSWQYLGQPVTQYWRKPAGEVTDSLRCAVNARYTYWMSSTPIPGGLAYENFELVEDFKDGQQFIFGITPRPPRDLLK